MRIVGIENGIVVTIFDWAESIEDITVLPEGIKAEYAHDRVVPGWIANDDGTYSAPSQAGFQYDDLTDRYYPHSEYRAVLHERTSNDTLEAMRKIREGDTAYDWQGWLDKLDAYNLAIEETKGQEEPVYPEYPTK